jgi:hypothetical protein
MIFLLAKASNCSCARTAGEIGAAAEAAEGVRRRECDEGLPLRLLLFDRKDPLSRQCEGDFLLVRADDAAGDVAMLRGRRAGEEEEFGASSSCASRAPSSCGWSICTTTGAERSSLVFSSTVPTFIPFVCCDDGGSTADDGGTTVALGITMSGVEGFATAGVSGEGSLTSTANVALDPFCAIEIAALEIVTGPTAERAADAAATPASGAVCLGQVTSSGSNSSSSSFLAT